MTDPTPDLNREPTEGALPYVEADDGLADFAADDFTLDADAAELPDLSDAIPPQPPELVDGQDAEAGEGYGSGVPAFVRPTHDALGLVRQFIRNHTTVLVGRCLQITRGWWNVGPYYAAAKDSLAGAKALGVAHRVEFSEAGVARIPKGVAVYFDGPRSQYGHIAPTFGGGFCGSSDWPAGKIGRVNIYALAKAWGYTEVWWAPVVNDVRIWTPRRKAKATTLLTRYLADQGNEKLLQRLADEGDGSKPGEVKAAAQRILNGHADRVRAAQLEQRAGRRIAAGQQGLRNLEVTK